MKKKASKIVAAVGPKGSGKSFWVKQQVRAHSGRVAIFDVTGEYLPGSERERIPGLVCFESVRAFLEAARAGPLRKKYAVKGSWRDFSAFCSFVYATGDWLCVFEELTAFSHELKTSRPWRDLENRSRHRRIDLLLVGHRPPSLPPNLRAQVDEYVVFKTNEPNDLKFWEQRAGDNKVSERIRALGRFKSLTL